MLTQEQDRVGRAMHDIAQGDRAGQTFGFDPKTKTLRILNDDPDESTLQITPSDLEHFTDACMVALTEEALEPFRGKVGHFDFPLRRLDEGDAYSVIGASQERPEVLARLRVGSQGICPCDAGNGDREVELTAQWQQTPAEPGSATDSRSSLWTVQAVVRKNGHWTKASVAIVPVREELFSRTKGLFETAALADPTVCIFGLGSGGSPIGDEMGKLGIMNLILVDDDRVEVANVVRHVGGLRDVGRFKTKVMAERILNKNPYANVQTHETRISWKTKDLVRDLVRKSHLTICGIDDPDGRNVVNWACVQEKRPVLFPGAFRRAYGGQILFVEPGVTPCYQCFQMTLPAMTRDQEVSSRRQAQRLAYTDRPVVPEPGLSIDIAPISLMVVKLAIQYLLRGKPTGLRSLDEDLIAPWYLWINRREPGTDYAQLAPLACDVSGFHVLRWYGVALPRNPDCPCCGDFVGRLREKEGL